MNSKKKRAIRCLVAALAFKKASTKKQKNFWTKPWLGRRNPLGVCRTLLQELKNEDSDSFRNFLRCSPQQFLTLLNLITDKIARKATNMRSPIQPEERLAVTLRYLATGKFHHLHAHEWLTIAKDFNEKWNFPNCLGAVDGKHVVIQAPNNSGSYFYNYKNTHSVVLMAAVDASYRFIYVDVGTNGRTSDGGTFQNCSLNQALECNDLNIPEPTPLPSRNKPTPYVFCC
ncbi:unnamed protein product [Mytilus coruscus]|uniref:DDE Tnp4 domain-containing protein n=1 Tax=Mytilus coruscus TaxID=42192 RepID=A0A6J8CGG5_MYTCO|nr:unnamed protein product [Mytilus coruscus]